VFAAYNKLYTDIRDPEAVDLTLDPFDVRDETLLNSSFVAGAKNSSFLSEMHDSLQNTQREVFNYLAALSDVVNGELSKGANRSTDLRILTQTLDANVLVAGDDFADYSRIDKSLSQDQIEVVPLGGAVSLSRTGSVDVVAETEPDIFVDGPAGLYEGKKYGTLAPVSTAEPEGRAFRFEATSGTYREVEGRGLSPELESRYQTISAFFDSNPAQKAQAGLSGELTPSVGLSIAKSSGSFAGLSIQEWDQIANNFHYERTFVDAPPTVLELGEKLNPDTRDTARNTDPFSFLTQIGKGDIEEVNEKRKSIVDDSSDTYWQAELVVDTTDEFNRVRFDESTQEAVPLLDFETLTRQVQDQFDRGRDLNVSVTLDFKYPRLINFVTLLPMHFHESQVLEVTGISYSFDGSDYISIPEALGNGFERSLVSDVNKELTGVEVALSLSANKYALSGNGLFAFDSVSARYLRISLRERVPVPVIYHTVRFLLHRTVTTRVKKTSFWKVKRSTSVEHYSKVIDLDYAQSLQMIVNEVDKEQYVGDPFSIQKTGHTNSAGRFFGTDTRRRVEDTGWELMDVVLIPKYDKARYVLGIRELRVFSYTYSGVGNFVSTPFFTPKPIETVSLIVNESIPSSIAEEVAAPLKYYFSIDDGANWSPIAAIGSRTQFAGGVHVPQIYHVNSAVPNNQRDLNVGYVDTSNPPRSVRFKAIFTRGSNENVTPLLKGYRLKLRVKGGL